MKLAWATDIHLDTADAAAITRFLKAIREGSPDALALSGDISNGSVLMEHLELLDNSLQIPIYFVLGNHDYWERSFATIRKDFRKLSDRSNLVWLNQKRVTSLTDKVCIVGHDGWYDGGHGDWWRSRVRMNDDHEIAELRVPRQLLWEIINKLAVDAAKHIGDCLDEAFDMLGFERAIIVTHVPPFPDAAWHAGKPQEADWLPHFTSKHMGDMLRAKAALYPKKKMRVLCGHTHTKRRVEIEPNLTVWAGAAAYTKPRLQEVINVLED